MENLNRIKVGVVGVGRWGENFVRNLKYNFINEVDFVGIFDINIERAKEISYKYKVKFFENLDKLIEKSDAIICATSTQSHYSVSKEVLKHKKHLFVEKPITTSLKEAEELVKEAKEKKVILQVGCIERFNPAFLAIKNEVKKAFYIEAERLMMFDPQRTEVDVILDLMYHDIDLSFLFLKTKEKPKSFKISAIGVPVLSKEVDIANARIEFSSGEIIDLTASRVSREKLRKIRFYTPEKYISVNLLDKKVDFYTKDKNGLKKVDIKVPQKEPLYLEIKNFVDSIKENKKPEVDGETGLFNLKIALEIKEKIHKRFKKIKKVMKKR